MPERIEFGCTHARVAVSACPHPFETRRFDYSVPAGLSITEIVEIIQPDPLLRAHGIALIGEAVIDRALWSRVRPKPGTRLTLRLLPSGGGGLRIALTVVIAIAAIAATVLTAGAAAPLNAAWFAGASSAAGALAGAAVSVAGTLLLNTLLPPPAAELSGDYGTDTPSYAITAQRNEARQWSKVPFLLGRFRLTPPYAALPYREVVGGEIYWRALFALSHGPVMISELKIGETPLSNFQDVAWEFHRGYWQLPDAGHFEAGSGVFPSAPSFGDTYACVSAGTVDGTAYAVGDTITFNGLDDPARAAAWDRNQNVPFSLFPDDVYDDPLNVAVRYGTPQIRTSRINADELAIELIFERGICHIENVPAGKKKDAGVTVKIEQSPAGANAWSTVLIRTITGRQTTPLYWGHRWTTAEFGVANDTSDWDVRLTRLSGNADEERNFGNFSWFALRTLTRGNPVPIPGVAMIAMRIRSSEQLQGVLDSFSCVAQTIARDWDAHSATWLWRPTSSPAALFRHVLQHPLRERPATDAQIDLAKLEYWDGVTRPANRDFNGVIEAKGSLYDVLVKIGRVGRAMPTLRDLLFSVIIDEPKSAPVRLFTPRNSWTYDAEMTHAATAHAYRIGYVDAAQQWRADEVIVYDDGYTAANATRIDKVEWPGIIDRAQAWKEGRFHLAQQRLRREIHHITTDFEHLACERGDLVALQHDVIAVGLAAGRVKARTEDGGSITDVTLDETVMMQHGKSYGLRARRVVSGVMRVDLYPLRTVDGMSPRLFFAAPPPIADAPAVGDLVAFGEYDRETLRVLVRDIEPQADLTARLTLIAEAPGIHSAEQGPIPPYDPVVTRPRALPAPDVLAIASDERVMLVTPSRTLMDRVLFQLRPIDVENADLAVIYRLAGTFGGWQNATVQKEGASSYAIAGVTSGETYDFRLQYTHPDVFSSPVTAINSCVVIGRTTPPAELHNLSIAVVGGQALLRWDLPQDVDVRIGGWIAFRHTPDINAATWPNTTSLARTVAGDQTHVYAPLKPGTYFGRAYDADGRPSEHAVSVSTKQASVLAFTPLGDVQEDPLFTGMKTNCVVSDGALLLDDSTFDAVANVDDLADWDAPGGVAASGVYYFAAGIDLGAVTRARITSRVLLDAFNQHDYWDDRVGAIDGWPDIDGTSGASVDAAVYARLTDDDPAVSPTWSAFLRIDSAEIEARAIGEIECRLSTADAAFNLRLTELRVTAEQIA